MKINAIEQQVSSVIRGKEFAVKMAVVTLLARGHLLIEDVPGVGKTTLAYTLSRTVDCTFQRIQFTSDLLPSDITGVSIYNVESKSFEFHPGPIFANIVLADEINRTSPKTQSALLEAMNDRRVSVDLVTHRLPIPFMVVATQNPVEYHGTFPLPESQLDRFMLHLKLGYPAIEYEKMAIAAQKGMEEIEMMEPVVSANEVVAMQNEVDGIRVDDSLIDYILSIVNATRTDERVRLGASTRGAQFLKKAAMALAYYDGRAFVTPGDIKTIAPLVLGHRLIMKSGAGITDADVLVRGILDSIPVPL